jgi:putative ABC transport system permease protein
MPLLFLRRGSLRLLLVVTALAVAVAAVCTVDVVDRAVLRAFGTVIDGMAGRVALQVSAGGGGLFPEDVAWRVWKTPGVAVAAKVVSATAALADGSGEILTIHGVEVARDEVTRAYGGLGAGGTLDHPLVFARHPNALVLTRAFAERHGLRVKSRIALRTPHGRRRLVVGGIVDAEHTARLLGGNLAVMDLAAAETLFTRPGFISRVDVVLRDDADTDRVATAIAAKLPPALEVTRPLARTVDVERVKHAMEVMLWGAAVIALGMSFLIAAGGLAAHFDARAWQAGVLRAVGVRRGVVLRQLLQQALLIGAAGVGAGVPAGIALGRLAAPMVATTAALGADVAAPVTIPSVSPWSIGLAVVVGIVAALVAAALPAWRGARVSIADTVSCRGRDQRRAGTRLAWSIRGAVGAAIAGTVVLQAVTRSAAWGVVATGLIVMATALAARPLVDFVGARMLPVLFTLAGPAGPLASAGVLQNSRRTALAVATLGVGIGCVLWILTLGASFEGGLVDVLHATMRADLIVTSARAGAGWLPAPLDGRLVHELSELPDVAAVAGNRVIDWPYGGHRVAINAFDASYFRSPDLGRPTLRGEHATDVWEAVARGEAAIVSTSLARGFDLAVGDTLVLASPTGSVSLRIAGVTPAFLSSAGSVEMSRELFRHRWHDADVSRVWVSVRPGVDVSRVREHVARSLGTEHPLRILSSGEMRNDLASQVRRAFAPLRILWGVVLVVALVAVADALAAGVVQRVREIGAARAIGVRRRQIQRMVLAEGLTLGALGLVVASATAAVLARLWIGTTFSYLLGWVLEPKIPRDAVLVALTTLAVCLAAAVLPARRAARIEPAVALRWE